jgi:tRNA pseudouridine13 synthase
VGRALLCGRHKAAVDLILVGPHGGERDQIARVRAAYDEGRFQDALDILGPSFVTERKLLRYLARAGPRYQGAVGRLPRMARRLYLSAYQSSLFNRACADRLRAGALSRLWTGDVAMKHENGACFRVTAPEDQHGRLRSLAVSPTGPIFGKKMLRPEGRQGAAEDALLAGEELRCEDFHKIFPGLKLTGTRRAFRVPVEDLAWELRGKDAVLSFVLPKGCYATCLLRELVKPERLGDQAGNGRRPAEKRSQGMNEKMSKS